MGAGGWKQLSKRSACSSYWQPLWWAGWGSSGFCLVGRVTHFPQHHSLCCYFRVTLRCLKHPGAVAGGNGGSWEGAFCLDGGSWIGMDLWIEIQICDFFLLSRISSRIKSSQMPHFLRKSNPRKPKLCFAWYILSCAICGTARNHWHGEVGAAGLV